MGGTAQVDRSGSARDHATRDGTDVVRVDLEPDAVMLAAIDAERGAPGRKRLRQRHRCAAMEHARRLLGAVIDRHPRLQIVVAGLGQLDAQMADHRLRGAIVRIFERALVEPDHHPPALLF